MKRKALIIGSPDDKIKGVYDDMKNYRSFLEGSIGGEWRPGEITTLESPSISEVRREVGQLAASNYSLVIFSGHGAYSETDRATFLQINAREHVIEHELKNGAPMRTVILDTCRVFARAALRASLEKSAIVMDSQVAVRSSRSIFDERLDQCYPGLAVMYSCDRGESAGDIAGQGGRYSSSLIYACEQWRQKTPMGRSAVWSVSDAHDAATRIVQITSGNSQNPKGEFPRTLPRFPFAIRP